MKKGGAMIRFTFCALALVAAVATPAADLTQPFVIERIDVRNAERVSPRLIAAESLLRESRTYSHDDLRAAAARLARLPFLAAAEISTEDGSAPGRRVVIITVTEGRAFSFLVDARGVLLGESRTGLNTDYGFPDPVGPWKNAALGVRHVMGRGEAHVAMTVLRNRRGFGKNYSAWEIGYTGYDLFGTRAFATAKIRTPVDSVNERNFTPAVTVGMPLTVTQTLTVDVEDTVFRDETLSYASGSIRRLDAQRQITLDWTYNTTNEPFAPTRGTFVRIAPVWWMHEFTSALSAPPGYPAAPRTEHGTARGVELAAIRYWELSETHSVSAGLFGGWADLETRRSPASLDSSATNPGYEVVQLGYSRRLGKSRVELEARAVAYQENAFDDAVELSASWVRRSRWGTLRLGAGYVSAY
ncbi:MAG: POTRA domain-containing protein [Thermoanaerobaculia bacterium]